MKRPFDPRPHLSGVGVLFYIKQDGFDKTLLTCTITGGLPTNVDNFSFITRGNHNERR